MYFTLKIGKRRKTALCSYFSAYNNCKQKRSYKVGRIAMVDDNPIEVSLVIRGRYVPSFWTKSLEFADKKSIFDWKIVILGHFSYVNKQIRR